MKKHLKNLIFTKEQNLLFGVYIIVLGLYLVLGFPPKKFGVVLIVLGIATIILFTKENK